MEYAGGTYDTANPSSVGAFKVELAPIGRVPTPVPIIASTQATPPTGHPAHPIPSWSAIFQAKAPDFLKMVLYSGDIGATAWLGRDGTLNTCWHVVNGWLNGDRATQSVPLQWWNSHGQQPGWNGQDTWGGLSRGSPRGTMWRALPCNPTLRPANPCRRDCNGTRIRYGWESR